MADISIADDGFLEVAIGATAARLDLYEVYYRLLEIDRDTEGKPLREYLAAIGQYLQELGYGAVSQRAAERFSAAVSERVKALKNAEAGEPTPGSPASTGPASTSSADATA